MYTRNNINSLNYFNPKGIKNAAIDEILRGEISAVEAYEQVMDKVKEDPELYRLRQFKLNHENAVQFWKKQARISGKIPAKKSSVWGSVVEAFVGISKLIGEDVALLALRKGEEHGLSLYDEMLKSNELSAFQKDEIRKVFLPRQQRHIESISALLKIS